MYRYDLTGVLIPQIIIQHDFLMDYTRGYSTGSGGCTSLVSFVEDQVSR